MSARHIAAAAIVTLGALMAIAASGPAPFAQTVTRPADWSETTHGDDARPDYERLFAMDRVHELHIRIASEDFLAMQQDLATIGPAGMGGRMRGAFRGAPPPVTGGRGFPPDGLRGGPPGGLAPQLTTRDPIFVPVTVTHDGRTWTGVGMRYKGNSSLMSAAMSQAGKAPFRLDFDRYEDELPAILNQRFYGFQKLTFSSNYTDDSLLKEVLATEAFRDQGVPAARAAFYRIFVDTGNGDEYWGLYTMIEDPADGAMLDAQFGDGDGNLYKPEGPGANWTAFDETGFGKKTNETEADFTDVAGAVAALHAPQDDPAAWRAALESRFDVDGFLRWLAVNSLIANWDAYGRMAHNYYLYGDPGDGGRLQWIPWDHNMAFGSGIGPGMRPPPGGPQSEAPVPAGGPPTGGPPDGFFRGFGPMMGGSVDMLHRQADQSWPLIARILADDIYEARYRQALEAALDGLLAPDTFAARVAELHAMIAPFVVGANGERPTHTTLSSPAGFESSADSLIEQMARQREAARTALAAER